MHISSKLFIVTLSDDLEEVTEIIKKSGIAKHIANVRTDAAGGRCFKIMSETEEELKEARKTIRRLSRGKPKFGVIW